MTGEPRPQAEAFSSTGGHEQTDVGIGLITAFVVVFALIIAVSMPLLWWMLNHFENVAEKTDPDLSPLANPRAEPPRPRLQAAPAADYSEFRRQQLERLEGTGWIDREQKIVHIPIERAMELILTEGLPRPKSSTQNGNDDRPASRSRDTSSPPDSSSGDDATENQERPPAEEAQP